VAKQEAAAAAAVCIFSIKMMKTFAEKINGLIFLFYRVGVCVCVAV